MSGQGVAHMTLGVHVRNKTSMGVEVFDAREHAGPFVTVQIGDTPSSVSLFVRDEDDLNRLLTAVGEARAKLAGAITRAKRDKATQPELPDLAAS